MKVKGRMAAAAAAEVASPLDPVGSDPGCLGDACPLPSPAACLRRRCHWAQERCCCSTSSLSDDAGRPGEGGGLLGTGLPSRSLPCSSAGSSSKVATCATLSRSPDSANRMLSMKTAHANVVAGGAWLEEGDGDEVSTCRAGCSKALSSVVRHAGQTSCMTSL